MKSRELVALLEFYLDRGVRYGIMDEHAAEEARFLLRSLEDGYRLVFTRSALVFDFEKDGSEVDHEHGIEFHRVGSNLIRELVEAAAPTPEEEGRFVRGDRARGSGCGTQQGRAQPPSRSRTEHPALEAAAFLGSSRERTVSVGGSRPRPGADEESSPAIAARSTSEHAGSRRASTPVVEPPAAKPVRPSRP